MPTLPSSYQQNSIEELANDEQDVTRDETIGLVSMKPSRKREVMDRLLGSRRGKRKTVLLALLSIGIVVLVSGVVPLIIPTQTEVELAHEYDEHASFGTYKKVRTAQKLADASRLSFLSDSIDFSKILKKVNKEDNAANDYMDHATPEGCEATVLIVRHCEKGSVREHCAYIGYERSVYLATLFGHDEDSRWPAPSYIFAEGPKDRHNRHKMNFREIETVGPLAEKIGIPIDDSYSTRSANKLVRQILTFLQTGQMCGKVTLIAWKHSGIGHLAHRLGCGPAQGCPLDYKGRSFDEAWQIKFSYKRPEHSKSKSLTVPSKPEWNVYGSVQPEGFDPLAFSKRAGDYPSGGTDHGARWKKRQVDFPERTTNKGTAGWKETRVGFDLSNP